jgi:hypothetical protein
MWGRLTGYLTGKGNDGGPQSPTGQAATYAASSQQAATAHTLLVHFVLHDDESIDAARLFADALSREFAFGVPSAHVWASTGSLGSCIAETSPLFCRPGEAKGPKEPGFDEGGEDGDLPSRAESMLKHLHSDGSGLQRFAVTHALNEPTSHVVILASKSLTSTLIPAVRELALELPVACIGGLPRQLACRPGAVTVVTAAEVAHSEANNNVMYSDADDDDNGAGAAMGETAHISLAELSDGARFNAAHGRIRQRMLALEAVRGSGASEGAAVAMDAPQELSAATPALLSCQSRWELSRLRGNQLQLLRTVAGNLHQSFNNHAGNADSARSAANFRSINAGTERFYDSLGRFPAAARVLFNLGYATPKPAGVLEYAEDPRLEQFRSADRTRTIALIDDLLAPAN